MINDLLGHTDTIRYAYYKDDGMLVTEGLDVSKLPAGTYTVKECTHEGICTYTHIENTSRHTKTCLACGETLDTEDCTYGTGYMHDDTNHTQACTACDGGEGCPSHGFTDLGSVGTWYHEAVDYVLRNDLIGSYGNGLFGPNDNITWEQLAVMLWRYAESPAATAKELHFSDAGKVGAYARDAMRWAVENSIINDKGGGILDPKGRLRRY